MPRVSKARGLSPSKKSLFIDDFYSAVTSLKDKDEVKDFFEDLLTQKEKLMLGKRFQIAMMHRLRYLHREISERIKVIEATAGKIILRLDYGRGGLKKVADRIIVLKKKKLEQFRKRKDREYLGPAILKAGLGVLIQEKKKRKKKKSVVS